MFLFHGWTLSYNRYRKTVESIYFPQYIKFDMNAYEKVWTWKAIAIISKWIKMWGWLLDNTLLHILTFTTSILLTTYFVSQLNSYLVIFLLILLIAGQILWVYLNILVSNIRQKRIELDNIWSKNVVKIIMAKMEILQSQRINWEIEKLHDLHEWQIYYNKKMAYFLVPFFWLWNLIIVILLFVIFIYFGNLYFSWWVSLGLIAATSWAILMMQKEFINTLDFLKNFWRDFAEIQNMWDFFDSTPQIQWYDTGETFLHSSW